MAFTASGSTRRGRRSAASFRSTPTRPVTQQFSIGGGGRRRRRLIVWESSGQDGNGYGVYGQRFRSPNPPVKFSNIQVNDGSAQRSMVTSLKITFDSPVSFAGSPAAAFSLVNQMTTNAATLSAAVDGSGTVVTLTFTGGSVDLGGSLSDGRYTLTIIGSQFTGNGFDGNGDGIAGDNYVLIGAPANGLYPPLRRRRRRRRRGHHRLRRLPHRVRRAVPHLRLRQRRRRGHQRLRGIPRAVWGDHLTASCWRRVGLAVSPSSGARRLFGGIQAAFYSPVTDGR